jgi:hypothetical protein
VQVVLAAAISAPVSAMTKPENDWPSLSNSASSAGFSVVQMATSRSAEFVREWNRPGRHGEVHGDTRVHLRQPIDTFIAFRGCRADAKGQCNVTTTFEITGPDGKSQSSPPMEVWANRPQPTPGMIFLSRASLGLAFAPDEPTGAYRIRAAVTDHIAGVTLHTQQTITLLK